ncbi:MAG: FAD-binding oxidoreductase [Smithella sp.]
MAYKYKTFYSYDDLKGHLLSHAPGFYHSSKTSTVIPYDKIKSFLNWNQTDNFYICDLSNLPRHMELTSNNNLVVRGAVSWEDAKKFLKSEGRNLKTSPTEQLALVTAGVATSCTGERCFGFGTMRSQIVRLKYLDFNGDEKELFRDHSFRSNSSHLNSYKADFKQYEIFKNAPYPRFENAADLMIGTEGQLGIVTEVEIETAENEDVTYVFILLPRWEENYEPHMEIFRAIQSHRRSILSCEILDSNCMNYLKTEERLGSNQDVIFLEVKSSAFEDIYRHVFRRLSLTSLDDFLKISENKFHHVRADAPLAVFEENSKMGVVKVGTDVQVTADKFIDLLNFYREFSKIGVRYGLFGHFGDAHLHFNYMPSKEQTVQCEDGFRKLYDKVYDWRGSPFAEHGIGLIKQEYIKRFYGPNQLGLFHDLKKEHDPYNQFFPQGFMSQG